MHTLPSPIPPSLRPRTPDSAPRRVKLKRKPLRISPGPACPSQVSLPSFGLGLPAYYVIAPSEASSNLSRFDGLRYGPQAAGATAAESLRATRGERFGPEVKRRILMGTYALTAGYYDAYYKRAQQVRTVVRREMAGALAGVDALLTPAAPTVAYRLGDKTSDPLSMYVGDLMTVNVNLVRWELAFLGRALRPCNCCCRWCSLRPRQGNNRR